MCIHILHVEFCCKISNKQELSVLILLFWRFVDLTLSVKSLHHFDFKLQESNQLFIRIVYRYLLQRKCLVCHKIYHSDPYLDLLLQFVLIPPLYDTKPSILKIILILLKPPKLNTLTYDILYLPYRRSQDSSKV